MKWLRTIVGGVVYFCAASFIAIAVGIGVLWSKGDLDGPKFVDILAAVYGLDLAEMRVRLQEAQQGPGDVQIAYNKILDARTKASLDIDLRESAIDKTLGELHNLQNNVVIQRERHNQVVKSFEQRLTDYENNNDDQRLRKVRELIENMRPKQAKELLMMMVNDDAMDDVVGILGSLASDKQKKIIAEFKTPDEQTTLNLLLKEIRKGKMENDLLNGVRDKLKDVGQQP